MVGWPIQFVENMIVIYDLQGKTNLISRDDILSIYDTKTTNEQVQIKTSTQLSFSFGNNFPMCDKKSSFEKILPTRSISEKNKRLIIIQLFDEGFKNCIAFKDEHAFTQKPFYTDKKTRLGLVITDIRYLNQPIGLPSYFSWANQRPFGQSSVVLGSRPIDYLPSVDPLFAVQSELKLHLMHLLLVTFWLFQQERAIFHKIAFGFKISLKRNMMVIFYFSIALIIQL